MQLYSMEQSRSQALEAHAADFSTVQVLAIVAIILGFSDAVFQGIAI